MNYPKLLLDLLEERGWRCELCGEFSALYDADHAIFPRSTYRREITELDSKYNMIILCRSCHERKPSNYRTWGWEKNCARYGRDVMGQWRDKLHLKIKTM